jgi:pyridoxamine 5'-phosphate oxidase
LAAWASPQSEVLASRADLDARYAETVARFEGVADVPRPPFWGGYRIVPSVVEFWSRGEDRMHDRLRFSREGEGWRVDRLAP